MGKIHITNGRIIDPANNIDETGSLFIADGKILSVLKPVAGFSPDLTIDATGSIVCPGLVDLSVRLRDFAQPHKATLQSETAAAASAGITSLCLPPDTQPVIDTQALTELIYDKAKQANYSQIYPIAALTQQLAGTKLSAMAALKQAGCIAVSNANAPLANLLVLRRAMEYASSYNLLLMHHPQEFSLSNQGCVHEGSFSTRYGLPGIPAVAESIALTQCLELAELTGCQLHFSQLSCQQAVLKIEQAKKHGSAVTADVAIHQLHLTENEIEPFNSHYHTLPPLRAEQDRQQLKAGLANGTINAICSDHQPHDLDAKLGAFPETAPGVSSLETLLPLMLALVHEQTINLTQGIAALTHHPAQILGIRSGALTPCFKADVCIFDPELQWQVNQQNWKSAGLNTPFWGTTFRGRVTHTVQAGKVIYTLKPA